MSMNPKCFDLSAPVTLRRIGPDHVIFSQEGKLPSLRVGLRDGKLALECVRVEDVSGAAVLTDAAPGDLTASGLIRYEMLGDKAPFVVSDDGKATINASHFVVEPETELRRFARLYREAKERNLIE